jgi:DNA-binding response OmpR family regulator
MSTRATMSATILVIDDNVVLARAFSRALTGAGHRVHASHSAEDGLRQAKAEPPDLIILDLQMPFVNGVGFLYRLRSDEALCRTPVLVVTGRAVSGERATEIAELGAVLRLKPISLEALIGESTALLARGAAAASTAARGQRLLAS